MILADPPTTIQEQPQPDITFNRNNEFRFEIYLKNRLTWYDAQNRCQNKGGFLAKIERPAEKQHIVNAAIQYLMKDGSEPRWKSFWIGLKMGKNFHFT